MKENTQTKCSFADGVICLREDGCAGCAVWDKAVLEAELDLDICPVCGADRKVWLELFGTDHVCFAGGK